MRGTFSSAATFLGILQRQARSHQADLGDSVSAPRPKAAGEYPWQATQD